MTKNILCKNTFLWKIYLFFNYSMLNILTVHYKTCVKSYNINNFIVFSLSTFFFRICKCIVFYFIQHY